MAVGTLTAIPVRAPSTIDDRVAGRAMLLAPVAALPLAAAAVLIVFLGTQIGAYPLVTATVAIAAVALGSRGLHLDGLADTADGLSASYNRERALDVMRRGDVGPMGAVTLVLVLLGQVAALTGAITAGHGMLAVAIAVMTGRLALPLCCVRGVPSARPDGLGDTVAGTVGRIPAAILVVVVAGLATAGAYAVNLPWWQGILAVLIGLVAAAALLARCVRRLGGITGDVLGACVEIATLAALIAIGV